MKYAVGSLVRAREREWVVLPQSTDYLLVLRPLGGTDAEVTGILPALESVTPATFDLPDPDRPGDHRSCRLLRDAVRLGFRNSAGPFRSFARIAVDPRPYQIVPLLMALRRNPVRLLIADDVGIGKTIEACLIARELLDRGEIDRLAVLCLPQLAEQWQAELRDKFHIDAELVLPATVGRLERHCGLNQSVFDVFPFVVVSSDFVKSDRRRDEFLRTCPEMVIVDEAHTCAFAGDRSGGRHQRHQLVNGLCSKSDRHVILVTATPHSGHPNAFRSLVSLLSPEFRDIPDDLSGSANETIRRKLAHFYIQRRRADIVHYMNEGTPFPERLEREEPYTLTAEYKAFLDHVIRYARATVKVEGETRFRTRVRWWSALALLRSVASSPAAAIATLRARAASADAQTDADADEIGRRVVLDLTDDESLDDADVAPGSDYEAEDGPAINRQQLRRLASEAEKLTGDKDRKLQNAVGLIKQLLNDGFMPIVFCRFIPTAVYVAAALRAKLGKAAEVAAVTGMLPPDEREARIGELMMHERHVLVCTDCLSEGINLQEGFNAVVHYDLAWNPTRHEQREGRVDRYGQPSKKVRVVTYFGKDNAIDGIVLDVLLRKHKAIRSSTGISVPVPIDSEQVLEAVFEGFLLRERAGSLVYQPTLFDDYFADHRTEMHTEWQSAADREKQSRSLFAHGGIRVEEVSRLLDEARTAIGSAADAQRFFREGLLAHRASVAGDGILTVHMADLGTPRALREAMELPDGVKVTFDFPPPGGVMHLSRTHPSVEALAAYVLDTALDTRADGVARRCGVIVTRAVQRRTTLLLLRLRCHLITRRRDGERQLLAEDCLMLAFESAPEQAQWLDDDAVRRLLTAEPDANITPDLAANHLRRILDGYDYLRPELDNRVRERARALRESHERVRKEAQIPGVSYDVEPYLPPDVLGVYVYLPKT